MDFLIDVLMLFHARPTVLSSVGPQIHILAHQTMTPTVAEVAGLAQLKMRGYRCTITSALAALSVGQDEVILRSTCNPNPIRLSHRVRSLKVIIHRYLDGVEVETASFAVPSPQSGGF